jgi:hypothetical protein
MSMANPAPIRPRTTMLRIWGTDSRNRPFVEQVRLRSVEPQSAVLEGWLDVRPGDIVSVQLENVRAHCRISWIGEEGSPRSGLFALSFLDHLDKWAALSGDGSAPVMGPSETPPRSSERFRCAGVAEVRSAASRFPIHCELADISLSGCYLRTTHPPDPATEIDLLLRLSGRPPIRARAVVRSSHPLVGMGVQFLQIPPDSFPGLLDFLRAQERERQHALVGLGSSADTDPEAEALHALIEHVLEQVHDLQARLTATRLDDRLLHPLRQSVLHTRVVLALAAQWIARTSSRQDADAVFRALHTELAATATSLLHELSDGLRSGGLQLDPPALERLCSEVRSLAGSLPSGRR